jgi:hypothetical protein
MKDDLKRLMNEFLEESWKSRRAKRDLQLTSDMPKKFEEYTREPTLTDFIDWLNNNLEE